ncbi:hypothetical protein GCM10025863_06040 [Microbacterium suwonense]|uniref:Uncharacterized protein n=2 Tax=Microbacterium suwonense TaxID=683047 RepID=A0ABM8FQQ2_9MICO|nr:hypothetical protein GCM10025863_06040 [Microbacterium suwonense]
MSDGGEDSVSSFAATVPDAQRHAATKPSVIWRELIGDLVQQSADGMDGAIDELREGTTCWLGSAIAY